MRCPSCGNKYVIELQNNSKKASPPKPLSMLLSGTVLSTLNSKPTTSKAIEKKEDENADIPRTSHSFSSIGE